MVKATVEINERGNRIINIVKGLQGFKNRDQALNFILSEYEEELEPELRPEFIKRMRKIEKQKGIPFKNIRELRDIIEGD